MRIISTIFYIVFIALVVGTAGLVLGTMLPIPGNIELKIVKSGSMEPAIPTGSIVIVKPSAEYRFNDVITFGADTRTQIPTTHRIVGIEQAKDGPLYITKGDANEEADQNPAAKRDVIGKVIFSVPFAGYVLDFARQPLGFALLIGIPAALVILEELLTIARETRKWWRRRNGRDGEGGGHASGDDGHAREYVRKRSMDEIFVPSVIVPSRAARFLRSDAYGTSTMLVLGLMFTSFVVSGASGGTVAYFQDIERSIANRFAAAECDDFSEGSCLPPEPPPQLLRTAALAPEGEGAVLGEADEKTDQKPDEPAPAEQPEPAEEPEGQTAPIDPPAEKPATQTAPIESPEPEAAPKDDPAQTAPIEPIEAEHEPSTPAGDDIDDTE